jgi:tetratricopeptide (TPR) repeat protein
LNTTAFWNVRFDRANSYVFTLATTTGIFGLVCFFLLFVNLLLKGILTFIHEKKDEIWKPLFLFLPAWISLGIAFVFYGANMTLIIFFFILAGFLATSIKQSFFTCSLALKRGLHPLVFGIFIFICLAIVAIVWMSLFRYRADIAFAKAVRLDRTNASMEEVTEKLNQAATLNRFEDIYYRNLAEALFVQMQTSVQKKSSQTLSSEDQIYLQQLLSASINAVVFATHLSPNNALNWSMASKIYSQAIPFLPNVSSFAIQAFTKAMILEPTFPGHLVDLGQMYLLLADQQKALLQATDKEKQRQAQETRQMNWQQAEQWFTKAIELKKDYAKAHYELALLYHLEGRMDEAIGKMEDVISYNSRDSQVFYELGLLYLKRNNPKDIIRAQKVFETSVTLSPSYGNALWMLSSVYEKQGKKDLAISLLEHLLSLNPKDEKVQNELEKLQAIP